MDSSDKTAIVLTIGVCVTIIGMIATLVYSSYLSNEQTLECIKGGTSALECKSALFQ